MSSKPPSDRDPSRPRSVDPDLLSTVPMTSFQRPPERIGPYRVLEQIGEGGMGVVYLAEQEKPVKRKVALKIIKLGMDTEEVVGRFEAERQALAMMNHPNIAKVFDAGATEQGRPYFVMEHVPGERITAYCDRHRLTTKERLELFIPVCLGIHHAHQKAIIHRDIKPSNVLVMLQDGKPVPKVIDFGVAKAIDHRLTEKTVFTEQGRIIGTPAYMSPEQAEMTGLSVDTTTDVYSLGVLLYELMVGAPPFDSASMRNAGLNAIQRMIREVNPLKPSTRISQLGAEATLVAQKRGAEPHTLERQLSGEVDWIIMRAMEKDRNRRYTSASEFAADVRRMLNHEPVLASPPSTSYRLKKFVERHRVGVVASSIVILAMVLGTVGTTIGLVRARQASRQARQAQLQAAREAERAEQVSEFLVGLFEVSNPSKALGETITAREILDEGAYKIEKELSDLPEVQATLMNTMGEVYRSLGLYDSARPLLKNALETRRRVLGEDHPDVAASIYSLAVLLYHVGDYEGAERLHREALAMRRKLLGDEHPDVAMSLLGLANVLMAKDDYEGAERLHREALAMQRKALGEEHPDVANSLNNLARLLANKDDYEEAEEVYQEALAMQRKVLGEEHPDVANSLNNLAGLLANRGDFDGAVALNREALAMQRKILGKEHPEVATSLSTLGMLLFFKGDYEGSEAANREALAMRKRLLGEVHPDVARTLYNLACSKALQGRPREAIDYLRQASRSGFYDADWLMKDTDLTSLRGDPEFEAVVAEVKAKKGKRKEP